MDHVTRPATPSNTGPPERLSTVADEEIPDIGIGDDILVADDTPANLIAIEAALAPLGRRLVLVHSGIAALARLLDQDFALIVLDVAMPGMTGIETARLIRARERNRGTPIVFVTAMSWQDEAIEEAYEAGGFDFLVKPIRPEVLRAKVRVFLKLQERTRALRRQAEELRASQARLYEHELLEQRKRFESELLAGKLERLAEGDRRQHELATLIGSELLNPLHTLRVAFDLLREHPHADRDERIHTLIEHWLRHVTRLVEGLSDIAPLAAGQLVISPEVVNLAEIVRCALDDCRAITQARKLTTRLDPGGAPAPIILGDPVRLLQALTTVIDHAVRSTVEGGELVIAIRLTGGDVALQVTYPGRGFGPAMLPRIFEICVAEDLGGDGCTGRHRLGFALARRLIELHDGTIQVSSGGVAHGATFEIRLPQAPQDVELSSLESADPLTRSTARMLVVDRSSDTSDTSDDLR